MSAGASLSPAELNDEIIELAAAHQFDPAGWANIAWDWGVGDLEELDGPRQWQHELLSEIGEHLQDPAKRYEPLQIARSSGHGIGKSAAMGMIANWAMSCFADARVLCTANTEGQLRTKTVPEVAKWFRSSLTSGWFDPQATSIKSLDRDHSDSWRMDFVPWSETNTEAFAGLHNKGKIIVLLFDEASKISDKVWEVAEGALTDEDTIILWVVFGNPTRSTGRFKECFGRLKHRWLHKQIDSRTVPGTNKAQIAKWEQDHGEDSDFFRVRVRGEFPRQGDQEFMSAEDVAAARRREAVSFVGDPLVFGLDVARFGDDESVLFRRRGRDARTEGPMHWRGLSTTQLAARVAEEYQKSLPDAVFVDEGGVGGGVVDRLRDLGVPVIGVNFGAASDGVAKNEARGEKFADKSAEMWGTCRAWLKAGGAIPDDPELEEQLLGREYFYDRNDAIRLESKRDMKERGLSSPDRADGLALTFAYPVTAKPTRTARRELHRAKRNWDYQPRV